MPSDQERDLELPQPTVVLDTSQRSCEYLKFLHDEISEVGRIVLVHKSTRDHVSETLYATFVAKDEITYRK